VVLTPELILFGERWEKNKQIVIHDFVVQTVMVVSS